MKNCTSTLLTPIAILLSVLSLTACRTLQTASDTTALHTASTASRDSIYLHDSVFVRIRADTVYLEKWHTRWRDREIVRTDTIHVQSTTTETVQVRYIPAFYKYSAAFTILIVLLLLVRLALYMKNRFLF